MSYKALDPVSATVTQAVCFHCGQHIPHGVSLSVPVGGLPRQMCCAGCQAVCAAIVENGLGDYYLHRSELPEQGAEPLLAVLGDLDLFDHPEFQKSFVRPLEDDEREADLILEGITCAACVWLNEQHLMRLPGVSGVQINFATHRARVRWHESRLKLSEILGAIAAIGYRAHPFDPERSEKLAHDERRTALWRLFVAGFGMMQVMMYALPAYVAGDGDMSASVERLMRWASMVLTLPVVFYSAAPFFQRALRDLRMKHLGMDVPVALGVGCAFLASSWATIVGNGQVYFDSVSMFVFFLLGGRYLEMLARQRAARGSEALGHLIPTFARRLQNDGSIEERVPATLLNAGDRLLVRPGETIVVDGVVLAGSSEVDEAWLTGESRPVARTVGDLVLGGSTNGTQALEIEAVKVGEATRLATVRRLMERAAAERPRVVALADRVAAWFTFALLLLAAATGLWWLQADSSRALEVFVSVLVVSCPCALSLATPIALTVATDTFARRGLLVTRGHAIETLARVSRFVFDKTGTLTVGRLRVNDVRCAPGVSAEQALAIAAALEVNSEHAVARAICAASGQVLQASDLELVIGQGVGGVVDGGRYRLGRLEYVSKMAGVPFPESLTTDTHSTIVYLGTNGGWLAAVSLDDVLRQDAKAALAALQGSGGTVSIFSGDARNPVAAIAAELGVSDARSGLTPEGKHGALEALLAHDVVAMIGDGINDAPVLALAHVSMAMSGGTELARNQADIVILDDCLKSIVAGREVAQQTLAVIRQNLLWAFLYNFLSIPFAMVGWVTPWMAGIGMGVSSLLVVLNALRIARAGGELVAWKKAFTS